MDIVSKRGFEALTYRFEEQTPEPGGATLVADGVWWIRMPMRGRLNHINVWSRGINGKPDLQQENIQEFLAPHIPIMADAATAIVVETWALYDPIIDMGLTDTEIYNIVVTSPRFTEQLMLEGVGDGGGSVHDDDSDEDNTI